MCKQLADILFPLNILGKKVRCVTYDTFSTPRIDNKKTFVIEWIGERLEVSWTIFQYYAIKPQQIKRNIPYKEIYVGGGTETIETSATLPPRAKSIVKDTLYFKCTKVTKLIINGEQII